jgi:hypothetical protein
MLFYIVWSQELFEMLSAIESSAAEQEKGHRSKTLCLVSMHYELLYFLGIFDLWLSEASNNISLSHNRIVHGREDTNLPGNHRARCIHHIRIGVYMECAYESVDFRDR